MFSLNFSPYVLKENKEKLLQYQYHGEDRSLIYKYFWRPLCSRAVHWLPMWLAPNTITVTGLVGVCIMHSVLYYYLPNLTLQPNPTLGNTSSSTSTASNAYLEPPSIIFVLSAFFLFMYQFLDNLDGHQARRTKSSSPLGLLMDHGCDAFNCIVGSLSIAACCCTGPTWKTWSAVMSTVIVFFFNTWEEYYRGALILPIINGANEGIVLAIGLYLFTAFFGPAWWLQSFCVPVSFMMPLAGVQKWLTTLSRVGSPKELHDFTVATLDVLGGWIFNVIAPLLRTVGISSLSEIPAYGASLLQRALGWFLPQETAVALTESLSWIENTWNPTLALSNVFELLKGNLVMLPTQLVQGSVQEVGRFSRSTLPGLQSVVFHDALNFVNVTAAATTKEMGAIQADANSGDGSTLTVVMQMNTLLVLVMTGSMLLTIAGNVYQVWVAVHKEDHTGDGKYGEGWLLRRVPFAHAITRLLPLIGITILANLWFMLSPRHIFASHPRLFCWTVGLLYTKLAIHLMIAHLCSTEFHPFRRTFIPFFYLGAHLTVSTLLQHYHQHTAAGGNTNPSNTAAVTTGSWFEHNETILLYEFFTLSVVTFLHLCINGVHEMARLLDVDVFNTKRQRDRAAAAAAAATIPAVAAPVTKGADAVKSPVSKTVKSPVAQQPAAAKPPTSPTTAKKGKGGK